MFEHALCYLATLGAFLAIDFVWLAWIARRTYAVELGSLLREQPNYLAAAAFYVLFAGGLTFFAVIPANSAAQAGALGAALGLVAYGTYSLTNYAVLRGFGLKIALIDLAWGAVASAATSVVAFLAVRGAVTG
jgi:uncharacterized membrane protein